MDATQRVASKAQAVMADIVERIRGSPVVHADETGWREDGHNGYVWTFSAPTQRTSPVQARGRLCGETSTICAPSTLMTRHCASGPMPSTNSTARLRS